MTNAKEKKIINKKKGDLIFYYSLITLPVLQFIVMYVFVNINAFFLSFQKYDFLNDRYFFLTDIFANYKKFFNEFALSRLLLDSLRNGAVAYLADVCIAVPLVLLFSFFIYKKIPAYNFFKIALFVPGVISTTVLVLIFTHTVENAVPAVLNLIGVKTGGLLSNPKTTFPTLIAFSIWSSAGGGVILYLSAMNGIPNEQVDAMRIDGAGYWKEFFHLTFPSIYKTFSILIWMGIPGIITNQLNLYTFFGNAAEARLYTFGYWFFKKTASANMSDYPYISAIGILQSLVVIPLLYSLKHLLEKIGPSSD